MNKNITKMLILALILSQLLFTAACGKKDAAQSGNNEGQPDISESGPSEPETVDGACNNVLYPLVLGNQWVYETQTQGEDGTPETAEFSWTVSEAYESSAVLGTLFYDSGVVLHSDIECQDGAILNFPITQLNMVFGEVEGEIEYDFTSGVFIPSLAEFEAGNWENTWETNITSSGSITATYEGDTLTMELADSPITINWEVLEKGVTIDVPAGSFDDVILVSQEIAYDINSLDVNIEGQAVNISTILTLNSNMWFAPYIGLLKKEVESATINLYGTNFPIDPMGNVELISSNIIE